MKCIHKYAILVLTFNILFIGISFAQQKAPFVISANSKSKDNRVHGKLIAINDTALVVVGKKDSVYYLPFNQLGLVRVDKNKSDIGFGILTGAAVAGSIVVASGIDEPLTAILVGAGGAIASVTVMSIIHGLAHPPILKLREKDGTFTRKMLLEKLSPYIVK